MKRKANKKKITTQILLEAWQEVLLILTSEVSLEEMLKRGLEVSCKALGAKYGTIMFEKRDKPGSLYIKADYGFPAEYHKEVNKMCREKNIPLESSPSGVAFAEEKQLVTNNIHTDPRWPNFEYLGRKYRYGSLLYTPLRLKAKEKPFGLIVVYKEKTYRTKNEAFPKIERNFMATIARPAAIMTENVRLYEELKNLSQSLSQKVKERTKELEKEKTELEKARTATLNVLEDVEEARGKAEEEKNKTLAIISNFSDGLLVFNKKGKLFLMNPRAELFFNVKSRDLVGWPILKLSTFPTLEPVVALVGKEIKGVFRKEVQIRENLVLEVSTIPIAREEEKLGTLIILHDITREKMIERIKTEFVSLAAHQLRTPLAAIKWTLNMFLEGDMGTITAEQRELLEKTYKSNERMIGLINDLLDVTRIEEGRYLHKPVLSNFENVVHFVINAHKDNIERKKIKLEFKKLNIKIPKIIIDVEKMRVVVDNLLDNAIKYTPSGGGITVSLDYSKKTKEVEFKIQDTGVGIPADQQDRVFSKFFRGANVIRMDTEGSGLGVFISKNIIEAHGGRIWFESAENKGTTFCFIIPVKEEFAEFLKEF